MAANSQLLYSNTANAWIGTVVTTNKRSNTARATSKRLNGYFHNYNKEFFVVKEITIWFLSTCGDMSTIMDKVLPRKPTIPIREKRTPSTSLNIRQIKSVKVHKSQTININNSPLELSPLQNVISTPAIQTPVEKHFTSKK